MPTAAADGTREPHVGPDEDKKELIRKLTSYVAAVVVGIVAISAMAWNSGAPERERVALIGAALAKHGCNEVPVVGAHIPALSRAEGTKPNRQHWFTFEVMACGNHWHAELLETTRPWVVTTLEKQQ